MKYVVVSGGKEDRPALDINILTIYRCYKRHWEGDNRCGLKPTLRSPWGTISDATKASSTGLLLKTIGLKICYLQWRVAVCLKWRGS